METGPAPFAAQFGLTTPPAESTSGSPGTPSLIAPHDHSHPRLTSAGTYTLDASGNATVTFTRSFAVPPAVTCLAIEAGAQQPVIFKVSSWSMTGALYTGCVINGVRASILPTLSGILLIGPLITSLANFNVFGGSAAGVTFSCIALQPSTP